jgi:hypothetical protein
VSGLGWLAGGVVAALLLAGCSGDEPAAEPPPLKAPTTSPVATESPTTPEPPVLPAAARENTKAGAVAFARFYVKILNFAVESGRVDVFRAATLRTCVSCRNIAEVLSEVYAHGGYVRGGDLTVKQYSVLPASRPQEWTLGLEVTAERQIIRSTKHAPPRSLKGGEYSLTLDVRRVGNLWRIARMERAR